MTQLVPSQRWILCLVIWISLALGYYVWRSSTIFVWDDSLVIIQNRYDSDVHREWGQPGILKYIAEGSFREIKLNGYRPLSEMIQRAGIVTFAPRDVDPKGWFMAKGFVVATFTLLYFFVARHFLNTDIAALLATFLFLFSSPVVTGSEIIFAGGTQMVVYPMICLGLLFYFNALKAGPFRPLYLVGLGLMLLIGPWFREFIGITPLLIIFLEWQRNRRSTWLMGIAVLFFIHALFPMAIVKWILYPDVKITSIFSIGLLGSQMALGQEQAPDLWHKLWSGLRKEVPWNFLTLYPPLLFILAVVAYVWSAFKKSVPSAAGRPSWLIFLADGRWKIILPAIFITISLVGTLGGYPFFFLGFWLCLGVALIGARQDIFLSFWFLLSFLPFLRIYTEQVHLAYALMPASIIMAYCVQWLWNSVRSYPKGLRILKYIFIFLMSVILSDQGMNVYGSYLVVRGINDGIATMARRCQELVPKDSILVTNVLHGDDIRLLSQNHMNIFYTVLPGVHRTERVVDEPWKLQNLLELNRGKREFYFLALDFVYPDDRSGYFPHRYARYQSVDMEDLGVLHTTQVVYPFMDPLRAYTPRPFISFLGPPDLENDFYRGPARDGRPFLREVYAEYHLYKVTGTKVWNDGGPVLSQGKYKGFKLLAINGRYFGIPPGINTISLDSVFRDKKFKRLVSYSLPDVLRQIDLSLELNDFKEK